MSDAEFEIRRLLDVDDGARAVVLRKTGKLDENAVLALRLDDGFSNAETIHTFADDFDGLIESAGDLVCVGKLAEIQLHQE